MVRAEIITVGAELLQGKTLDTNAHFLSGQLTGMGVSVAFRTSCGDCIRDIVDSLELAFARAEIIILTGGLGPTPDDVTREAVSEFFDVPLVFHVGQYRRVRAFFKAMGRTPPLATRREAMLPKTGIPLLNQCGIALGFYVKQKGKMLVVLPGVPREMERLFESRVRPVILKTFRSLPRIFELTVCLIGMDEARMMQRLGRRFFSRWKVGFGSYPVDGRLILRFKSENKRLLDSVRRVITRKLAGFIYSFEDEPLEAVLARQLFKKDLTLSVAESCTGGLLGKRLTDTPGASRYFLGGIQTYSNSAKMKFLSVPELLLRKKGAVSKEVAVAMAESVRGVFGSDLGVSITGIAGPAGGSSNKPVGLVWMALADRNKTLCRKFLFAGSRERIRFQASLRALWMIAQHTKNQKGVLK